jgi:hypothetical protein
VEDHFQEEEDHQDPQEALDNQINHSHKEGTMEEEAFKEHP